MVVREHDLGHPPAESLVGRDERTLQPAIFSVVGRAGIDQHRVGNSRQDDVGVSRRRQGRRGDGKHQEPRPKLDDAKRTKIGFVRLEQSRQSGLGAGIRQNAEQVKHRRRGERPAPLPEFERSRGSDPFAELELPRFDARLVRPIGGPLEQEEAIVETDGAERRRQPAAGEHQLGSVGNSQAGFLREFAQRPGDDSWCEVGAEDFTFRLRGHRVRLIATRRAAHRRLGIGALHGASGKGIPAAHEREPLRAPNPEDLEFARDPTPDHDRRGRARRLRRLGPGTTASNTPKYLLVKAHSFVPSVAPLRRRRDDKHRR